ncbi:MAG: hypothetical protein J6Y89_08695 [Lachnospiraceae bacterium]|nr:hypothetical protein [Lachnospiraceae bacterium]
MDRIDFSKVYGINEPEIMDNNGKAYVDFILEAYDSFYAQVLERCGLEDPQKNYIENDACSFVNIYLDIVPDGNAFKEYLSVTGDDLPDGDYIIELTKDEAAQLPDKVYEETKTILKEYAEDIQRL